MVRVAWCAVVVVVIACRGRTEPTATPATQTDAKLLVDRYCGNCHRPAAAMAIDAGAPAHGPTAHVPPIEELRALPVGAIVMSLERGTMRSVGATLSAGDRIAIAEYLAGAKYDPSGPTAYYCPPAREARFAGPAWTGWGADLDNSRFVPSARIAAKDVARLRVKWALALSPGRAGSTVVAHGTQLLFGDQAGKVRSVDRRSGCTDWIFDAGRWMRTAVHLHQVGDRQLACFGATQFPATYYCIDAATGSPVWQTDLVDHPMAYVSTAAALHDGTFYVPISVGRESHGAASDPNYACCTGRGALVAVDAATGTVRWRTFMTPEPQPTQKTAAGVQLYGPSGASAWKAPLVDPVRGRVYVTTGQNSTPPATKTSDALVAIDAKSGDIVWTYQFTAGDLWNGGCLPPDGSGARAGCPFVPKGGLDVSTPLLAKRPGGGRVLVVADKTGRVVGLDPDRDGAVLWQRKLGGGGFWGGVQWGMAADREHVYVPLHDRYPLGEGKLGHISGPQPDENAGELVALRLADGAEVWRARAPGDTCAGKQSCSKAFSSAPAVIPGVVFAGSLDGHVRAFASADGKLLWDFDTAREFATVDGTKASGGSIDGPGGIVVVDDTVILSSGYGAYNTMPGNVLLAFTLDGK